MDKELIIRNAFILMATVITFISAQFFLGPANVILSIIVFLISLFILNKDFTGSPLRVFIKIMSLTLFIGVVPYIANINMFIGLPVNFMSIFLLLYLLVYRLKKSIYFPFLLGYTLLLCANPSKHYFELRIYALFIIGIILFLVQMLINRKRLFKNKNNNLNAILKSMYAIIDNTFYENSTNFIKEFDTISKAWINTIFETRNNNFYLEKKEDLELNLISTLEKLKFDIIKLRKLNKKDDLQFIFKLKNSMSFLIKFAEGSINTTKLNIAIPNITFVENENISKHFIIYEIEESILIIKNLLIELKMEEVSKFNIKRTTHDLAEFFKVLKDHFTPNSVRFTFAFRTAFSISVVYFIIQYFNIDHGSWIIYTIASVSQPYNDTLKKRGIHRVKGTVLGAIYFLVLFYIFRNTFERYIILMATVYINSFMKTYDKQITYITLLVLGLASLTEPNNNTILSFDRIYLVIIGVIITFISARLIFPYYISKETDFMINDYYKIGENVVEKLFSITKFENNRLEIQNQILLAKSIENKILINNTVLDSTTLQEFLSKERYLLLKAQSIINRVEYADISLQENRHERVSKLNKMKCNLKCIEKNDYIEDTIPVCLKPYFENIDKPSEWLIYKDIFEILVAAKTCTNLKNKILDI